MPNGIEIDLTVFTQWRAPWAGVVVSWPLETFQNIKLSAILEEHRVLAETDKIIRTDFDKKSTCSSLDLVRSTISDILEKVICDKCVVPPLISAFLSFLFTIRFAVNEFAVNL